MDNFFDENRGEELPEKEVQRNPAPSVSSERPKKPRRKKEGKIRWWHVITAVCIAVFAFFGGYVVCMGTLDGEIRTLLSVKKSIQKDYYKEVTDEDFYRAVFGGINDDLLDAYSEYMTPEEYAEVLKEMEGSRSGVGLVFQGSGEDSLRIIRVCGNSPAENAGIAAGEKILRCGKAEDSLVACATFDEFSALIQAYAEGEEFCIGVEGASGERVVKISKQAYVENYVFYRTSTESYAFTGEEATELTQKGAPMEYLPADTAYVRLIQFTGNAAKEFDGAMAKFKVGGKKNLILDLRENGGGYLDIMQSVSSYFCKNSTEKKPIVAIADYGDRMVEYRATGNLYGEYFAQDSQIFVLADSGTASASECLIGCMLDYGAVAYGDICLVERYGEARTFGKGIMQETKLVNFLEGDALKLTTAEIRWPKGNSIHGRGVLPEDGAKVAKQNTNFEEETKGALAMLFGE